MSEIEDIYASFGEQQSFGLPGAHEYMSNGILGQGSMQQQYGMGFHMGIDPYHGMWEHLETAGEDGVAVKRESRWEQAYRH
jgi:hypothetical protein